MFLGRRKLGVKRFIYFKSAKMEGLRSFAEPLMSVKT